MLFVVVLSFLILLYSVNTTNVLSSTHQTCDQGDQVCLINTGVSVIDISLLLNNATENERNVIRSSIGASCRQWGMFYITNHGIEEIAKEFQEQIKVFFESSKEIKNSVRRQANNSRGFADDELTKQKLDEKEIFDVGHKPVESLPDDAIENRMLDGYNQWPAGRNLEKFRSISERYYKACSELASVLLSAMAYDLGINPTVFDESFRNHTSFLRLNYYPVLAPKGGGDVSLGVSRHTDAGVLTLLLQDKNSALEVYSGSKEDNNDGKWVNVDPVEGSLAINVCDMLQVWSNDEYKAPEHRVKASLKEKRYSSPFFYNPNYDVNITPFVTDRSVLKTPKYNPINYGQFRQNRFNGDFADTGKETQIEDFITMFSS
jgi:isopenicillin N synthase-like dioxygenase